MKEKFKQTSIFSTFKRKFDIFKWQVKKSSREEREEPILLGIKSTRTNCELSDDFEYIDSRRILSPGCSDIYASITSIDIDNNNCNIVKTDTKPNKNTEKQADKSFVVTRSTSIVSKNENEIEIFERKFLSPLSSSKSTTTIFIEDVPNNNAKVKLRSRVSRQVMTSSSSSSSSTSTVTTTTLPVIPSVQPQPQVQSSHVRVLRTSSKDSDCDSGAYSRSSSPENIYERLDRSCEKLADSDPLQSPNLVLSVIKPLKESYKSKINSNLLLSCLNEAGKSSLFCSLDNLNRISQPRHFKKNAALRKLSIDPPVSVTVGSHTHMSLSSSKSETDLNTIHEKYDLIKSLQQRSHKNFLKNKIGMPVETQPTSKSIKSSIKICDCQVTVNGQHICNFSS